MYSMYICILYDSTCAQLHAVLYETIGMYNVHVCRSDTDPMWTHIVTCTCTTQHKHVNGQLFVSGDVWWQKSQWEALVVH